MTVVRLDAPYKSQLDDDADASRNDCGPACLAMLLNGLNIPTTTNAVFARTGAGPDEFTSTTQLSQVSATYGVELTWSVGLKLGQLRAYVNMGRAPIALVHYGTWSERGLTESQFTGPHFVVVVGYSADTVVIHDPLYSPARRSEGENRSYDTNLFMEAWGRAHEDCWAPGRCNPDFGALIPGPKHTIERQVVPADTLRRIQAWSAAQRRGTPDLRHRASLTSYLQAIGNWGRKPVAHTVREDDTLPILGVIYYGSARYGEVVALFNGLDAGEQLRPGQVVLIPEPRNPSTRPVGDVGRVPGRL